MSSHENNKYLKTLMSHIHCSGDINDIYNQVANYVPDYIIKFGYAVFHQILEKDGGTIYHPNSYSSSRAVEILSQELSEKEIIKVLKHPVWMSKESRAADMVYCRLKHMIFGLIHNMFRTNHPYLNLVIKHVDGELLRSAILAIPDYRSEKLIDRAIKSKDFRIRKFAATCCKTAKLKGLLKDPNRAVRRQAIKRLGLYNVAKELLDDKDPWIRFEAASYLRRKDIVIEVIKEDIEWLTGEKNKVKYNWRRESRISRGLDMLDKKEIPYFLSVKGVSSHLDKIIEDKLSQ